MRYLSTSIRGYQADARRARSKNQVFAILSLSSRAGIGSRGISSKLLYSTGGKSSMTIKEFLNGYPGLEESIEKLFK